MNEQYVEERISKYSATRILYDEFAEQILNILKTMIRQEYPDIKIASYSKRAKEVESLRKKLRKDKYNENSEITHEKGYKFEGELPRELERRKNLLAGMLELADLEMDAYVESYDNYVSRIEREMEKGCLKYQLNSMSLERFMAWKFPNISPQVFRDIDLILSELKLFGLDTVQQLNDLIRSKFEDEIQRTEWRSLDGIIRNILIINNVDKYFTKVWNPSMNQMNRKNYELYQRFGVKIDSICKEYKIYIV